ncbi:Kinase [Hexamita inflata]|uniref:Kinase n=1 Tax=Hexamita inflata TaxID=28002 RepID=A0AA86PE09_9EUKA|nr:Kinase [Hexamita inflata]
MNLNQILSISESEMIIQQQLGKGARSSVYQVKFNEDICAMKYLMQSSLQNKQLLKFEFEFMKNFGQYNLTEQTYEQLSNVFNHEIPPLDILNNIIHKTVPNPHDLKEKPTFRYLMNVFKQFNIKELTEDQFKMLKLQLVGFAFLLHQNNLVYRDFSPYNTLLNDNMFTIIDYEEVVEIGSQIVYPATSRYSFNDQATIQNDLLSLVIMFAERYKQLPWDEYKFKEDIKKIQTQCQKDNWDVFKNYDKTVDNMLLLINSLENNQ